MDYLKKYDVKTYINAHDTITLYGGSRMAEHTKEAMDQISGHFVDIMDLQVKLGEHIAEVTHNEAAYISNGAAGAVLLCSAVVMAGGDAFAYRNLPDTAGLKDEFLVFAAQHNCYDKAIEAAGGRIRCIGDADEVLDFDLIGNIDEHTAGIFYFPSIKYKRASLSLEKTIEIAHNKGVPVIVDAAALLPPVENLWKFTKMGADMVIFSGGKTLCGPQASGLIVGKRKWIMDCIRFGAPKHGICRSSKVSREGMIGLCAAIDDYVEKDHAAESKKFAGWMGELVKEMEDCGIFDSFLVDYGAVGQSYQRAFGRVKSPYSADDIAAIMKERGVYIGTEPDTNSIYFSPLNLTDGECEEVKKCLRSVVEEMEMGEKAE